MKHKRFLLMDRFDTLVELATATRKIGLQYVRKNWDNLLCKDDFGSKADAMDLWNDPSFLNIIDSGLEFLDNSGAPVLSVGFDTLRDYLKCQNQD